MKFFVLHYVIFGNGGITVGKGKKETETEERWKPRVGDTYLQNNRGKHTVTVNLVPVRHFK